MFAAKTATSSKNVQSEVREVEKVLHKHTHPQQVPVVVVVLIIIKKVIDETIWSVWSFLDSYIFFFMHLWSKGQIRCFRRVDMGDASPRLLMCRRGALLRIVAVLDGEV